MQTGVKFRCYPNKSQKEVFSKWIGTTRFVYNQKVKQDNLAYKKYKETGKKSKIDQTTSWMKTEETKWLKEIPSQIIRNASYKWYQAKLRSIKGLSNPPRTHKKKSKESVLLTKELFKFDKGELIIGTKRNNLGKLRFKGHRVYKEPDSIRILRENNKYYITFNYDTKETPKTEEELLKYYSIMPLEYLEKITLGIDRGVVKPLACSDGRDFGYSDKEKKRLKKLTKKKIRYQIRLSKSKKNSKNREKKKSKLGGIHQKIVNIKNDFSHKVSHKIATSENQIIVLEDLKITNLTKRCKAKKDEVTGKWLKNGQSRKSKLNQAILDVCLGKIKDFIVYKAIKLGKLVIKVNPRYSSQECSKCGNIHPDNRQSQSDFVCLSCGYTDNADRNASYVIKMRGIYYTLEVNRLYFLESLKIEVK